MDAKQTPLIDLLERVPVDARLVIDEPDGMGSTFIPIGRLCREAITALRAALAQPEPRREWQGLTDEEIDDMSLGGTDSELRKQQFARAIEAALKERNT